MTNVVSPTGEVQGNPNTFGTNVPDIIDAWIEGESFPQDTNPWATPGELYTGIAGPGAAVYPWISIEPITLVPDLATIAISFSAPLDPSVLTNGSLSVWRTALLNYQNRIKVNGTWAFADDTVLFPGDMPGGTNSAVYFTPTDTIFPNNRYCCYIGRNCISAAGQYLPKAEKYHFFSKLFPIYSNPYAVRQNLGEYEANVSEEQLMFELWNASVICNRETMIVVAPFTLIGGPDSQNVVAWNYNRTFAMDRFTLYECIENILKNLLVKYTDQSNRAEEGLDFSTDIKNKVADLKFAIAETHKRREPWYQEISRKKARMRTTQKSGLWPAHVGAGDWSYRPRRGF